MKSYRIKLSIFYILISVLALNNAYSQNRYGKKEEIEILKSSELTIILASKKSESSKYIAKLKKKGKTREIAQYKKRIAEHNSKVAPFNKYLEETIRKYWKFNGSKLAFSEKINLKHTASPNTPLFTLSLLKYSLNNYSGISNTNPLGFAELFTTFSLDMDEGSKKGKKQVAFVVVPNEPKETDLIYGLRLMQDYLNSRLSGGSKRPGGKVPYAHFAKENKNILKDKVLLIDKSLLHKKLNARNIKEYYPHKYKVTDKAEIEKAILENDKRYAYVQMAPYGARTQTGAIMFIPAHHIISTEDGKLLGYSKMKHISVNVHPIDNMRIIKGNLKQYVNP